MLCRGSTDFSLMLEKQNCRRGKDRLRWGTNQETLRGLINTVPRGKMTKRDEVQITQTVVFALIPLLAGSPFRVFNPPGYPFLPKPPLRVFDLLGV
ncbi:hypothetical protein KIW84_024868 [Lathyrus oleraceus]|uniref:Uncharacterized protein n=1 Tax=Pisum sativum TaxID=3888 RepID=A0A9D5B890_PEA|nr:hypothetical protein KIW84_024868 [Pisum sativum]